MTGADRVRRSTLGLLAWAIVGGVVVVVTYVVMVRLRLGQRIDFSAYEGRKWTAHGFRRLVTFVVRIATPVVVFGATLASVVVARRRRGIVAATAVAVTVPVTLVLDVGLKAVLPRTELLVGSWISAGNTYPSGHVATIAVTMLVAIAVSPPRSRPAVSTVAVVAVTLQVLGIAGSGWHRPSDLVGGLGIAVMVASPASILVIRGWRAPTAPTAPVPATALVPPTASAVPVRSWWSSPEPVLKGAVAVVSATLLWYAVGRLLGGRSYGSFPLHLFVVLCTVVAGYASVVVQARLVESGDSAVR